MWTLTKFCFWIVGTFIVLVVVIQLLALPVGIFRALRREPPGMVSPSASFESVKPADVVIAIVYGVLLGIGVAAFLSVLTAWYVSDRLGYQVALGIVFFFYSAQAQSLHSSYARTGRGLYDSAGDRLVAALHGGCWFAAIASLVAVNLLK